MQIVKQVNNIKDTFSYCFNDRPGYPAILKLNNLKKKFTFSINKGNFYQLSLYLFSMVVLNLNLL